MSPFCAPMPPWACICQVHTLGGNHSWELPKSDITLSRVFRTVLSSKASLGITDWGVTNASLEQVFHTIVHQGGQR